MGPGVWLGTSAGERVSEWPPGWSGPPGLTPKLLFSRVLVPTPGRTGSLCLLCLLQPSWRPIATRYGSQGHVYLCVSSLKFLEKGPGSSFYPLGHCPSDWPAEPALGEIETVDVALPTCQAASSAQVPFQAFPGRPSLPGHRSSPPPWSGSLGTHSGP